MKINSKGITLIVLVISVLVILILGTITIEVAFGEEGFLHESRKFQDNASDDEYYTKQDLDEVTTYFEEIKGTSEKYKGKTTPNANYQVERANTFDIVYADTLEEAYNISDSGTYIKVLKDVTDNSTIEIDKDITIDTNGKTITRNQEISTKENSNCTLTIKGNGKITSSTACIINNGNGTIEINDGTIDSATNAIRNIANGTVIIEGGIITGSRELSESGGTYPLIINSTNGIIEINDGELTSEKSQALWNKGEGTITVNGGTAIAKNSWCVENDSSGTIEINDGEITSETSVALWNPGQGTITINRGTLTSKNASTVQNDSSGIVEINDGEITSETGYALYNKGEGTITINGGTIDSERNAIGNISNGTVIIKGIITGGRYVSDTGTTYPLIINNTNGTIEINDGEITAEKSKVLRNIGEGTITINGGTIDSETGYALYNKGEGTITINGGTIDSERNAIGNISNGTVIIKGGVITGSRYISDKGGTYPLINNTNGTIEINDGELTSEKGYVLKNIGEGTITVNEGTLISKNSDVVINDSTGTITVNGGKLSSLAGVSIYNTSTGRITINGGKILAEGNRYTIYNNSTGTITINGGKISSLTKQAIYNSSTGTITINGGEILAGANQYTIYNNSTGIITIGNQTKEIDATNPSIYGAVPVYNKNGTFNFYNGILKGTMRAYDSGSITNQRSGATLRAGNETIEGVTYKTAYY